MPPHLPLTMEDLPNEIVVHILLQTSWKGILMVSSSCLSLKERVTDIVGDETFLRRWKRSHKIGIFGRCRGNFYRWCFAAEWSLSLLEESFGPLRNSWMWASVLSMHREILLYSACITGNPDLALSTLPNLQIERGKDVKSYIDPLIRLLIQKERFEDLRDVTLGQGIIVQHSPWNLDAVPKEYHSCFRGVDPKQDRSKRHVSIRTPDVKIYLPFECCDANGVGPARPKLSVVINNCEDVVGKVVSHTGSNVEEDLWMVLIPLGCYEEEYIPEPYKQDLFQTPEVLIEKVSTFLREGNIQSYKKTAEYIRDSVWYDSCFMGTP